MVQRRGIHISHIALWIVIIIATTWGVFPFYWAIITSLKQPGVILTKPALIPWLQFQPTLYNWQLEFSSRLPEISKALRNSVIIAGGSTAIAIALGTLAGYGLARFRFQRWKNKDMTLWFLSQRFLPPMVTAIPFFLVMQSLKLLDTLIALILANATFTMPFAVLIMRDVFKELPEELEESAWVDGASRFGAFWYIALPLAAPAVAAAAVICFAFAWNEFLFALILSYRNAQPITVIIAGVEHTQGVQFWFVATRLLIAILPPALLALTAQRYIVRGLTFGAVKG
ncbi:MAG: carbohydrate ABC transporter permease [Anaerolineae bacterium]|nr:carbohydrate ABC transporter permease [Anaerolineae bacterium]MDW8100008.1 carbohydrate ABC transporter permease [Anaerolineae bacterium]